MKHETKKYIKRAISRRGFLSTASAMGLLAALPETSNAQSILEQVDLESIPEEVRASVLEVLKKCKHTKQMLGTSTMKQLYGKPEVGGMYFIDIVRNGIGNFDPAVPDERRIIGKLQAVERVFQMSTHRIRHREFFVQLPDVTEDNPSKRAAMIAVLNNCKNDLITPEPDHLVERSENPALITRITRLLHGWDALDKDGNTIGRAAGILDLYGDLTPAEFYGRFLEPDMSWRKMLVDYARFLGVTDELGSIPDPELKMRIEVAEENKCAYYNGTNWDCAFSVGDKCDIQSNGLPTSDSDICAP